jgi:cytidylate kinase
MSEKIIITLDGPAGCGKSTVCLKLAQHFALPFIDTGAMYRSVAYVAIEEKVDFDDAKKLKSIAEKLKFKFGFEDQEPWIEMSYDGADFKRLGREIRTPVVSAGASSISRHLKVREILVHQQQEIGREAGAVVEGRDAGTVIFPQADLKFFLTATPEERAKRRHLEMIAHHPDDVAHFEDILEKVKARDLQDSQRQHSPLKPAEGAIIVDTTELSMDQVVQHLILEVEKLQKA